jgi:glyoxylase-like metal-dependent hydrolase (beta-lactamase superfamily II)
MQPMIFQPIKETRETAIFPYIRKIDLMSSNSYILSAKNQIALIDPGGLEDQSDLLSREIVRLQDENPRPTVVYLTHVHIDHWIQVHRMMASTPMKQTYVAAQEAGARALENEDSNLTLASLLGRSIRSVSVPIKLLGQAQPGHDSSNQNSIDLDGWNYEYSTNNTEILDGLMLQSQTIPLGGGDILEIFHTPGHSPDSISLKAGSLLFLGDLFFAPNPGMAGAFGWNRQDFMNSILKVLWILENRQIDLCFSGHGRSVDAQTARKTLEVLYSDAATLENIEDITPQWARRTSAYAQDLMNELERTFTIIAGRLVYIAHMLSTLEEEAEAREMEGLLDAEVLDDLFLEFRSFAGKLQAGKKLDIELVHKTGQVVGKLDRLFQKQKLGSVLDQSLLDRASRLLSDYSVTYRGYRPPYYVSYENVNNLICCILEQLKRKPYDEQAILNAESEEDYLKALGARIACVNLFDEVNLTFQPGSDGPFARMDKERFSDIFLDILERFAGAGLKDIKISVLCDDTWVTIQITATGTLPYHPLIQAARFLERTLALSGGLLEILFNDEGPAVEIELSALGDEWR